MKTRKILVFLSQLILVIALVVVIEYGFAIEDITEFIDEKVIPIIVGIGGAIMSIYSLLKPIFIKLSDSNKDLRDYVERTKILYDENRDIKEELVKGMKTIKDLESDITTLTEIIKLTCCEDEKLVQSGIAKQIYQRGEINEIKKQNNNL